MEDIRGGVTIEKSGIRDTSLALALDRYLWAGTPGCSLAAVDTFDCSKLEGLTVIF